MEALEREGNIAEAPRVPEASNPDLGVEVFILEPDDEPVVLEEGESTYEG